LVKAIRSFEQSDISDLPQVLRALAAMREAIRDGAYESKVLNDEVVTLCAVVSMFCLKR